MFHLTFKNYFVFVCLETTKEPTDTGGGFDQEDIKIIDNDDNDDFQGTDFGNGSNILHCTAFTNTMALMTSLLFMAMTSHWLLFSR